MHFALLVSQLPHVDDARAQYADMLTLTAQPHRVRRLAATVWSVLRGLARLKAHA